MNVTPKDFADLSQEVLKRGQRLRFQVKGDSMFPAVRDGDTLDVEPLTSQRVRKDDIVFYKSPRGMMVAHRAVRVFDAGGALRVVARGDANTGEAEEVDAREVLGRVVAVERRGRALRLDRGWRRYPVCGPRTARALLRLRGPRAGAARPEDLLMHALAQPQIPSAVREEMRGLLSPDLDWAYFFERLRAHSVTSIAYGNLRAFEEAQEAVPEDILEKMKSCYYSNAGRNALLCAKLEEVLLALQKKGIDVCLLKGISLIHTAYPDIAMRPMADMDLLVKRSERMQVHEALSALGYQCVEGGPDLLQSQDVTCLNSVIYRAPADAPFFIHLHWHLVSCTWPLTALVRAWDMEPVWRQARQCRVGDASALVLAAHHQLLHLCQHAFTHCLDRYVLLSDVLAVADAARQTLDARLFIDEMQRLRLRAVVAYIFAFAQRIFSRPPGPFFLPLPAPQGRIERRLVSLGRRGRRGYLLSYFFHLFLEDGGCAKIRFIFRTLFPSRFVLAQRFFLPASKVRFTHAVRRIRDHLR